MNCTFSASIFKFLILMSSTCFEPEGSSSGRRLCIQLRLHFKYIDMNISGLGSSVGIATDYGLDGPESNPGGDEIFHPFRQALEAHPASCKMGTGSFLGVKCGRGVLLTTHPLLVPRSWKSRAIPLLALWVTPGL